MILKNKMLISKKTPTNRAARRNTKLTNFISVFKLIGNYSKYSQASKLV